MGNWRNRPRFYRRRSPQRSWYSDRPSSSFGYGDDDGIPAWEKKFCELVGFVPWQKVVEANYFKSWYQGNVITWNDSACEETFHNAKKRFWSEINGLPCDISLPDPEMFIDDINWDSVIDPKLVIDLERAYFPAPDEGKVDLKPRRWDKDVRDSKMPFEQCNAETVLLKKPWESSDRVHGLDVAGKKSGRNLSENGGGNELKDLNNRLNPWEAKTSHENETSNDVTWGVCSGNGWETEGWGNSRWKSKDRGNNSWEEERWDNDGWNKSDHQNKKSRNAISIPSEECNAEYEMSKNPWEAKPSCGVVASKDSTWGACSGMVFEGRGWGSNRWKNKGWGSKSKEKKVQGNKGWDKYVQHPQGPKAENSSKPCRVYNHWRDGHLPNKVAVRDCEANTGGWGTWRTSDMKQTKWEVKRSSRDWEDLNEHFLKKDDIHSYHSSFRNSRFTWNDNRSSSEWKNVKVNRKVTSHR